MKYILHPDEIFLKGNNQPFFYDQLKSNLKKLFIGSKVKRIESGLLMDGVNNEESDRLALTPGIANFAEVCECQNEIDEMKKSVDDLLKDKKEKITFRISAERSYKKFHLSSLQIEREIGNYVVEKTDWTVALDKPEFTIHISVSKEATYIYGNVTGGAGGLPVGVSGRVLCLLSGGIDSPAAAYAMMKRGAEVELIHFQNQTQVTEEVSQKILDLTAVLAKYQGAINLSIVPFASFQRQIVMKVPAEFRMIITRRIMYKIAERVALRKKCLALVTGDSLGQVASQTLENLTAINEATETPILKFAPLIGTNKRDIMDIARRIGTLAISNRPYEDCCSLFVAKHPKTKSGLPQVLRIESGLDLSTLDKIEIKSYHISIN